MTSLRANFVLLLAGGLLVAGPGCLEDADEDALLEREPTIPAGEFFEVDLSMEEGQEVGYRWEAIAEAPLAFDVHSHTDAGLSYHQQTNASTGQGTFAAPNPGTYSLLWANEGQTPLTVEIHIEGDAKILATSP